MARRSTLAAGWERVLLLGFLGGNTESGPDQRTGYEPKFTYKISVITNGNDFVDFKNYKRQWMVECFVDIVKG